MDDAILSDIQTKGFKILLRVVATISYDGSEFFGFQRQKDRVSVASTLEEVLKKYGVVTNIVGSGRTDRGVHALNQVLHFDVKNLKIEIDRLKILLNRSLLKSGIYIKNLVIKDSSFHARYSANARAYRYIITQTYSPFSYKYLYFYNKKIDFNRICDGANLFRGVHDFKFFQKSGSKEIGDLTIREMKRANFYKKGDLFVFYFVANSFLRSQIRLIVGALLALNEMKISIKELESQISAKETIYNKPAPPNGLYLSRVYY